jgi:hypothetical protein
MISFKKYKSLPQSEQADILLEQGVFLEMIRQTSKLEVELYALEGFYVEVFFDRKTDEPLYLKAFRNLKLLEPYLIIIDIDHLFKVK